MSDAEGPSPAEPIVEAPSPAANDAVVDSLVAVDKRRKAESLSVKPEEADQWEGPGLKRIKKRLEGGKEEDLPELEPLDVLGTTVQASIVAKFDHCYLLEVSIGREKLHGVLYHAPPPDHSYPFIPPPVVTTGLALEAGQVVMKHPPRKNVEEKVKRDRHAPKLARTGYNFFFSEARAKDLKTNPERDEHERSAAIGEQWKKLTEEERKPYQEMAQNDKARYSAELAQYRERLARLGSPTEETS